MTGFADLMVRVRAGDPDANRELFDKYGDLLFRVVRKHLNPALRHQVDSADFVQEAWLAFLQQPNPSQKANFESPQQFGAFLATVARNKVVDVVRRGLMSVGYNVNREVRLDAKPVGKTAPPAVAHRETPSKSAVRRELQDALLNGLEPAYREIGKKIFQGEGPAEIAAAYGIHQRTVERVRKRIVDQLGTI